MIDPLNVFVDPRARITRRALKLMREGLDGDDLDVSTAIGGLLFAVAAIEIENVNLREDFGDLVTVIKQLHDVDVDGMLADAREFRYEFPVKVTAPDYWTNTRLAPEFVDEARESGIVLTVDGKREFRFEAADIGAGFWHVNLAVYEGDETIGYIASTIGYKNFGAIPADLLDTVNPTTFERVEDAIWFILNR